MMKKGEMPEQDDIQEMRENEETYKIFCNKLLPCIVGKNEWNKLCWQIHVSKIATISDEAFTILLLENSWDVWKEMADRDDDEENTPYATKPRWTNHSLAAKRYQGWCKEAHKRYNELYKKVQMDRESNKTFEINYLREKVNEKNNKKKRKRELAQAVIEEEKVICYDDLSDVGECEQV